LNKYLTTQECEEGTIIYNAFTCSCVMIRPFEYMNIFTDDVCDYAEFLVNNYFIVPEEYNEESLVDILRDRQSILITATYLDNPEHFTILTTSKCNARCFYCYELNLKNKAHMTIETAEKVAKYIMTYAPKYKPVSIEWFGGEPLFNKDVIDIISSRLASANIDFKSHMVSNGYLFDDKLVKIAANDWRVSNIQITIDGTEEVYNKTKNYIYKDTNAFQRVIQNIHKLLEVKIPVSVRMNCDTHNFEDLEKLIEYLSEEFKESQGFSMYVWPIFEEGFTRTPEEKEKLYSVISKLEKLIVEKGYRITFGIKDSINSVHCMADGGNGVVIFPKGELGVCEHYLDKNFIGHIDNPLDKNWEVIKEWRNYTSKEESCKQCPIYPQCLKLKNCPDENVCDQYQKDFNIGHIKLAIKQMWLDY